jgi:hypothetical protein
MPAHRPPRPASALFAALLALSLAVPAAASSSSLEGISGEDYRLFCGYMDALERDDIKKLKGKRRDKKIAKLAKLPRKKLMKAVNKVKEKGATCDEVGKLAETESQKAVDAVLGKRVLLYVLDYSDPSHVVASVVWMAMDQKKVVQEAATLAKTLADTVPIAKTIAIQAMKPGEKDPKNKAAVWFEAKAGPKRVAKIDPKRIKDFADSRYIRLFDGVKCSAQLAHETVLGYRRGPCEGKSM